VQKKLAQLLQLILLDGWNVPSQLILIKIKITQDWRITVIIGQRTLEVVEV